MALVKLGCQDLQTGKGWHKSTKSVLHQHARSMGPRSAISFRTHSQTISVSQSSSDAILTECFLYASQDTGSVCQMLTASGRGRVVLLNGNLECLGTCKQFNGYFFVEYLC